MTTNISYRFWFCKFRFFFSKIGNCSIHRGGATIYGRSKYPLAHAREGIQLFHLKKFNIATAPSRTRARGWPAAGEMPSSDANLMRVLLSSLGNGAVSRDTAPFCSLSSDVDALLLPIDASRRF